MDPNMRARAFRRVGHWRMWIGICTVITLTGVGMIVAPLVVPSLPLPHVPAPAPAHTALPPVGNALQGKEGAQPPVPLWITAPTATFAGPIIPVGLDAHGVMEAPEGANNDPVWSEAFWWRGGVMPGQVGNAVIGGHLDRRDGSPALFWNLHQLAVGDSVWVRTQQGITLHFVVKAVHAFANPAGGAADPVMQRIFGPAQTANLNLITCAGAWTGTEYNQKLVVFTTLVR